MDNIKEITWMCRFHPTDWFHEVGCPHNNDWSKEDLQRALETAKRSNDWHMHQINEMLRIPVEFPDRESDEYDQGCKDTISRMMQVIYGKPKNNNTNTSAEGDLGSSETSSPV